MAGLSLAKKETPKEMMSVRVEGGKTHVSINSSSLGLLLECPRKSYYVLKRGLRKTATNPATTYGSAIHAALETFYSSKRVERVLPSDFRNKMADLEFDESEHENLLLRAGQEFVRGMSELRMLEASDKRSVATGLWTLTHYFETYIDDPYEVMHDKDGPLTERTVRYPLFDSTDLYVEYFGSIDVILRHAITGHTLVADHKTSSVVGTDFYNRLKPNHQYTGYLLGAKRVLGLDTNSFMVNCIQVKAKPKTARGTPPHFPRQITNRSEQDYEEFEKTVVTAVRMYLSWCKENFFPLANVNACGMYRGCQFLDVCGANDPIRENILNANFEEGYAKT